MESSILHTEIGQRNVVLQINPWLPSSATTLLLAIRLDRPRRLERRSFSWTSSWIGPAHCILLKDRIEFFNFAIEFFDQFRNFHQHFSEFSKFSAILTEFGYFGACSRNSDKISSQFRRDIAVFVRKLWCSDWIFNIQFRKIDDDFWLNFRDWSGAKEC